jgi:hypothetical protein
MSIASKYPESAEPQISLGPVFSINPRYVKKIELIMSDDRCWLDVYTVGNAQLQTELESSEFVLALADKFIAANPAIEVERYPK